MRATQPRAHDFCAGAGHVVQSIAGPAVADEHARAAQPGGLRPFVRGVTGFGRVHFFNNHTSLTRDCWRQIRWPSLGGCSDIRTRSRCL